MYLSRGLHSIFYRVVFWLSVTQSFGQFAHVDNGVMAAVGHPQLMVLGTALTICNIIDKLGDERSPQGRRAGVEECPGKSTGRQEGYGPQVLDCRTPNFSVTSPNKLYPRVVRTSLCQVNPRELFTRSHHLAPGAIHRVGASKT